MPHSTEYHETVGKGEKWSLTEPFDASEAIC